MPHPMRARFGLSLLNRAVLFGGATLDDLLEAGELELAAGPRIDSAAVGICP